jgi:hypothetical protein
MRSFAKATPSATAECKPESFSVYRFCIHHVACLSTIAALDILRVILHWSSILFHHLGLLGLGLHLHLGWHGHHGFESFGGC